jgi:hypothetical protein
MIIYFCEAVMIRGLLLRLFYKAAIFLETLQTISVGRYHGILGFNKELRGMHI